MGAQALIMAPSWVIGRRPASKSRLQTQECRVSISQQLSRVPRCNRRGKWSRLRESPLTQALPHICIRSPNSARPQLAQSLKGSLSRVHWRSPSWNQILQVRAISKLNSPLRWHIQATLQSIASSRARLSQQTIVVAPILKLGNLWSLRARPLCTDLKTPRRSLKPVLQKYRKQTTSTSSRFNSHNSQSWLPQSTRVTNRMWARCPLLNLYSMWARPSAAILMRRRASRRASFTLIRRRKFRKLSITVVLHNSSKT